MDSSQDDICGDSSSSRSAVCIALQRRQENKAVDMVNIPSGYRVSHFFA
ncbi:hypothetical protein NB647_08400 [Oxalobacter aliiformigenes]|nr:hypothetical protein [Oxalobacter aliiformigenes]WAV88887.1 hypothetical protein NB647_08400 [Oxalobacter aliiformigenes]